MGKILPVFLTVLALGLVAGLLALFFVSYYGNCAGGPAGRPAAAPDAANWSQAPATDEERLCVQFFQLKNAGDPAAEKLLGPAPAVPAAPVSREEAERLQTDFFLRQDVRIVGSGRDKLTGALVLFTKGGASVPAIQVKTADGAETTGQRVLINPDVVVEVRDGRIYGVAARLHL